jgi:outer membrane protein
MSVYGSVVRRIGALMLGVGVVLAGFPAAATQPPPSAFSLDEIIAAALAHNPGIAASRADVETARRDVEVAEGRRQPALSLAANYQYLPTPGIIMPLEITQQIMSVPGNSGGVAGFTVSFPLYTGGRIPLRIRIAELGTLIAQHRLSGTVQDLIFNASSLYYTALRLDAAVAATQQSVESLERARQIEQEFVKVGKAPQLDLLRVEARLANVRQALISVQDTETVTLAGIETLMGTPVDSPIRVTGALAGPPAPPPSAPRDVPKLIEQALRHRPEYLALQAEQMQQEERVKLARAQLLPEVSLSATYGVQYAAGPATTQGAGVAMLGVTVPLYDATLSAQIRQEESALAALRHRVDNLRLAIGLEVEKAVVAIQDSAARIQAAEAGLAQAREALRIEQLRLKLGKGIITDVLQAQADLLQAELEHDAALADSQIAHVQLQRAVGTLEAPSKTADISSTASGTQ